VNIKVVLEYDGTEFSGWQQQSGRRTVEGELKRALRELTGHDLKVIAAGRTDAGAHALGQVVNFHLENGPPLRRLTDALNGVLPRDVSAVLAELVEEDFHARYSAIARRYRYRYFDRRARPAVDRQQCWWVVNPLDVAAMRAAARSLVGRHDWTSYCSASEPEGQRTRDMRSATVERRGRFVELELVAEGFLRGLVRGIAGALAEVGSGRQPPEWVGEVLAARNRALAARTAPARGLTLMEVLYE
jgi:tRNA pseudouridine38-40 synthase